MTTRRKVQTAGRKGKGLSGLPAVITFLSDFGTSDYFTGAVKGAILSVNPSAIIHDITHNVPPGDIGSGAFTLAAAYPAFPAGSIHVAVVDPGVGSSRRPIVVKSGKHLFVGPDNGIFSFIFRRDVGHKTYHVTSEQYFRQPISSTFHGRDVFAPVAAALSKGVSHESFGPLITDAVRLPLTSALKVEKDGEIHGQIIHIDHFGNCITDLTPDVVKSGASLLVKRKRITNFREFYDGAGNEPFAIWGSAGFLEISVNGGSAAEVLRVQRGDPVRVTTDKRR